MPYWEGVRGLGQGGLCRASVAHPKAPLTLGVGRARETSCGSRGVARSPEAPLYISLKSHLSTF